MLSEQVVRLVLCGATPSATFPKPSADATVLLAAAQELASAGHVSGAGGLWRGEVQDPWDGRYARHITGQACPVYMPHGAPPRQMLARSRRSDEKGTVELPRSDGQPEEFDPKTGAASELAERATLLVKVAAEGGSRSRIVHSWDSRIWNTLCMKALLKPRSGKSIHGDVCRTSSTSKKPLGPFPKAPCFTDRPRDTTERTHGCVPPMDGAVGHCPEESWKAVPYAYPVAKYSGDAGAEPVRDPKDRPRPCQCPDGSLGKPDALEEFDAHSVESDAGPGAAAARASPGLCARFGVVLGERLEQAANKAGRSRHFRSGGNDGHKLRACVFLPRSLGLVFPILGLFSPRSISPMPSTARGSARRGGCAALPNRTAPTPGTLASRLARSARHPAKDVRPLRRPASCSRWLRRP